jgi:poly(3-hydroxybutyrate) depolymerase
VPQTLKVRLAGMTDVVPGENELSEQSSLKRARNRVKAGGKVEKGEMVKKLTRGGEVYYVYAPDTYDPNVACSVLIWLHPPGKNKEKDVEDFVTTWASFADDRHVILVCPITPDPGGWTDQDRGWIVQAVRAVARTYTIDTRRVVAHGMGQGGEFALHLGFHERALVRGVATVGAAAGAPRERAINEPLSFFLVCGGKDPNKEAVVQTRKKLAEFEYPVIHREVTNMGVEYVDGKSGVPTLEELVRWIDSLDRM